MYLIVAIVVYRYTGVDVASPALGSASNVVMKVAYGIALPTVSPTSFVVVQSLTQGPLDSPSRCDIRSRRF